MWKTFNSVCVKTAELHFYELWRPLGGYMISHHQKRWDVNVQNLRQNVWNTLKSLKLFSHQVKWPWKWHLNRSDRRLGDRPLGATKEVMATHKKLCFSVSVFPIFNMCSLVPMSPSNYVPLHLYSWQICSFNRYGSWYLFPSSTYVPQYLLSCNYAPQYHSWYLCFFILLFLYMFTYVPWYLCSFIFLFLEIYCPQDPYFCSLTSMFPCISLSLYFLVYICSPLPMFLCYFISWYLCFLMPTFLHYLGEMLPMSSSHCTRGSGHPWQANQI